MQSLSPHTGTAAGGSLGFTVSLVRQMDGQMKLGHGGDCSLMHEHDGHGAGSNFMQREAMGSSHALGGLKPQESMTMTTKDI